MITALAVSAKVQTLWTILGEGALLFLVSLIGLVVPWIGKPVSTKRYVALCAVSTTIWVLVAAVFAIHG